MKKIILDAACLPEDIERRSFEIIDAEIPQPRPFDGELWAVARRCIHACGDPEILNSLRLHSDALAAGLEAMRNGCSIYTDTRMLAAGLVARRMQPLGIKVVPLMDIPDIATIAKTRGMTRSRCGISMISQRLAGQIVAIGNAPTALLGLLEELREKNEEQAPALIIGMPVGFVNASQSKEMLAQSQCRHFTLLGRKGGSAIAAACVNAMAEIILAGKKQAVI